MPIISFGVTVAEFDLLREVAVKHGFDGGDPAARKKMAHYLVVSGLKESEEAKEA